MSRFATHLILIASIAVMLPQISGAATWTNESFPAQSADFNISFFATPAANKNGAIVAISNTTVNQDANAAASIRFNSNGFIDVKSGTKYAALTSVPYVAGRKYHFVVRFHLSSHTYFVYVIPPGASQITLASNDALATTSSNASPLDVFAFSTGVEISSLVLPSAPSTTTVFDFSSQALPAGLTFSRTGPARYFNSSGLLTLAPANAPRFEFNPETGLFNGLLIEGASTNEILQSQDFDVSSAWMTSSASALSLSTAAGTAPDGTSTAQLLTETTATAARMLTQFNVATPPGKFVTTSVFIRQPATNGARFAYLKIDDAQTADGFYAIYDLSAHEVYSGKANVPTGSRSAQTRAGLVSVGHGWYRAWLSGIVAPTGGSKAVKVRIGMSSKTSMSAYVGNGSEGLYIWGAQFENDTSVPSSYIATTTAPASRAADSLSLSDVTSLAASPNLMIDGLFSRPNYESDLNAPAATLMDLCTGSNCAGNHLTAGFSPYSQQIALHSAVNSRESSQNFTSTDETLTNETDYEVALNVTGGTSQLFINGSAGKTAAFITPHFDQVRLGSSSSGSAALNGHLKSVTVSTIPQTSSNLVTLTKSHLPKTAAIVASRDSRGLGDAAAADQFETWLGAPAHSTATNDFLWGAGSNVKLYWSSWTKSLDLMVDCWQIGHNTTTFSCATAKGDPKRKIFLAVPLLASGLYNLVDAANGAYDDQYRYLAQTLATSYGGVYSDITIRLGWEMNLTSWSWACQAGQEKNYIAAFRHVASILKSQPGLNVKIDWNPSYGTQNLDVPNAESCYPGDDAVDMIGLDVYDMDWINIPDNKARWQYTLNAANGLYWLRDFGLKHKKPLSFPEWATGYRMDANNKPTGGPGDNPYFIQQMSYFFKNNDVAYHGYWNQLSVGGLDTKLDSTDGSVADFPQAAAMFKKSFGPGN